MSPTRKRREALARAWDDDGVGVEDTAGYHFFGTSVSAAVDIQAYVEGWDADWGLAAGPRAQRFDRSYRVIAIGAEASGGVLRLRYR